jgi:hypothetical protein
MRIAAVLLLASATAIASAAERNFEKTMPLPRTGRASLGWTANGCSVRSVSLRNQPTREDIDKARHDDPDDKSWLWWDFHVENRGSEKCRVQLWVDIYDRSGRVVKSGDRSDTVDAHKLDDNIRLSTRMRTLDIADSPKARVRATIGPK